MIDHWQSQVPGTEPVAHRLRTAFPDWSVLFHTLPNSKRYPESESEYAVVLDRHNRVLGDLLPLDSAVLLLTTSYSETPAPPTHHELTPHARHWRGAPLHEDGFDEPSYCHVFVSEWQWQPRLFDRLLRLIADASIHNLMILPPDCRWLLHRYDGGMDLIGESRGARDLLRATFQDWLSPEPNGL